MRIEFLCRKISEYISSELNLDEDKKSVINYGIFAFLQIMICVMLVIIFGYLFNVLKEALIISFTSSILRKSSGGAHSNSPGKCAVIGTISTVLMALAVKKLNLTDVRINVLCGSIVFIYSYYVTNKLAPVDSINKPIKKEEKRMRLKKKSLYIITIYLIIVLANIVLYLLLCKDYFLNYSLSIYMGLSWQIFSLTRTGHLVLEKVDDLFEINYFLKGGEVNEE